MRGAITHRSSGGNSKKILQTESQKKEGKTLDWESPNKKKKPEILISVRYRIHKKKREGGKIRGERISL